MLKKEENLQRRVIVLGEKGDLRQVTEIPEVKKGD